MFSFSLSFNVRSLRQAVVSVFFISSYPGWSFLFLFSLFILHLFLFVFFPPLAFSSTHICLFFLFWLLWPTALPLLPLLMTHSNSLLYQDVRRCPVGLEVIPRLSASHPSRHFDSPTSSFCVVLVSSGSVSAGQLRYNPHLQPPSWEITLRYYYNSEAKIQSDPGL